MLGKQSVGYGDLIHLPQEFLFLSWLSWGPLSLIPRIPRPSWMKFRFGSSQTSVAFSLKRELWVWLEKEMRRRVKLTKRIHLL